MIDPNELAFAEGNYTEPTLRDVIDSGEIGENTANLSSFEDITDDDRPFWTRFKDNMGEWFQQSMWYMCWSCWARPRRFCCRHICKIFIALFIIALIIVVIVLGGHYWNKYHEVKIGCIEQAKEKSLAGFSTKFCTGTKTNDLIQKLVEESLQPCTEIEKKNMLVVLKTTVFQTKCPKQYKNAVEILCETESAMEVIQRSKCLVLTAAEKTQFFNFINDIFKPMCTTEAVTNGFNQGLEEVDKRCNNNPLYSTPAPKPIGQSSSTSSSNISVSLSSNSMPTPLEESSTAESSTSFPLSSTPAPTPYEESSTATSTNSVPLSSTLAPKPKDESSTSTSSTISVPLPSTPAPKPTKKDSTPVSSSSVPPASTQKP